MIPFRTPWTYDIRAHMVPLGLRTVAQGVVNTEMLPKSIDYIAGNFPSVEPMNARDLLVYQMSCRW